MMLDKYSLSAASVTMDLFICDYKSVTYFATDGVFTASTGLRMTHRNILKLLMIIIFLMPVEAQCSPEQTSGAS